jgi:hypothetical protein
MLFFFFFFFFFFLNLLGVLRRGKRRFNLDLKEAGKGRGEKGHVKA